MDYTDKRKIHFRTPMNWMLCSHAGYNSRETRGISQVTCKFCLFYYDRPQYQKHLKAWQDKQARAKAKIDSNPNIRRPGWSMLPFSSEGLQE